MHNGSILCNTRLLRTWETAFKLTFRHCREKKTEKRLTTHKIVRMTPVHFIHVKLNSAFVLNAVRVFSEFIVQLKS